MKAAPAKANPSLRYGMLAVALALGWQTLTVTFNWHGNWTALFCTGDKTSIPPQLIAGTYRFANSGGYDGQMYRYIARDPLNRHGYDKYLDAPMMRYRRILVPFLAFALAAGAEDWIDAAYIVVIAGCVFAGTYWLSRWAVMQGRNAAWGLLFLLAPATLIGIDTLTVDIALAALTAGFAYSLAARSRIGLYFVLILACLARETGGLLVGAMCIYELWSRQWRRSIMWATAAIPALAWFVYLGARLPAPGMLGVTLWFSSVPGQGIIARLLHPRAYALAARTETIARIFDAISIIGIAMGVAIAILLLMRARKPLPIAAFLYSLLALALSSPLVWTDPFSYPRVLTPLLMLLPLIAAANQSSLRMWWWTALPLVLVDLRIFLQIGPQMLGIVKGIV